jgi:hypothetical protein
MDRNAVHFDLLFCLSPGPFTQPISVCFFCSLLRWATRTLLCINTRRFLMVDSPFCSFLWFSRNQLITPIFLALSPHFFPALSKCLVESSSLDLSRRGKKKRLWQLFFDPVAMKKKTRLRLLRTTATNTPLPTLRFSVPFLLPFLSSKYQYCNLVSLITFRLLFVSSCTHSQRSDTKLTLRTTLDCDSIMFRIKVI